METTKSIFFVTPEEEENLNMCYACFDTYEKANDFLHRFKTNKHLQIVEVELNPEYLRDKEQDPYFISINIKGNIPNNIYIADNLPDVDAAKDECYEFHYDFNLIPEDGLFFINLFAKDKTEALNKAISIRDSLIANGVAMEVWQRAFNRYFKIRCN